MMARKILEKKNIYIYKTRLYSNVYKHLQLYTLHENIIKLHRSLKSLGANHIGEKTSI